MIQKNGNMLINKVVHPRGKDYLTSFREQRGSG